MKFSSSVVALAAICSSAMIGSSSAFVVRSPAVVNVQYASLLSSQRTQPGWSNHPSTSSALARSSVRMFEGSNDDDPANEIARLKSMAAKLRAEASALEAEKAQSMADAAEKAFRKFDTNQDGVINVSELKEGLEKILKMELPETRVNDLMSEFDKSGDGVLRVDEFVTVDKFRNRLESLAREEKQIAMDATKKAKTEAEEAKQAEAILELINDKPPTGQDKLLSVLPYLFPLMDGLQFGRFLLAGEDGSNPVVAVIALLYTLYRSIPFSGFAAFFALNFLAGNPSINRLIRFNMQQAIFLDIALFFPSLLASLGGIALNAGGVQIPTQISELGTDAVFVTLLVTLAYCSVSSLLGQEPNKVPLISQNVADRMPNINDFVDESGKIKKFEPRENDDENDKDKK
eukprot:scaffold109946_cov37-Attheya_sp.AAC.1